MSFMEVPANIPGEMSCRGSRRTQRLPPRATFALENCAIQRSQELSLFCRQKYFSAHVTLPAQAADSDIEV